MRKGTIHTLWFMPVFVSFFLLIFSLQPAVVLGEVEEGSLTEAVKRVTAVAGSKNNPDRSLEKLQLDTWNFLPKDQAEKVKEVLDTIVEEDIDISVAIQGSLTAVIGTNITQAFTVTLDAGAYSESVTVHASFRYAHMDAPVYYDEVDIATSKVEGIAGEKNKAHHRLAEIVLDVGKILPNHQAEKVKEIIEAYIGDDSLNVQVTVQHPLSTIIGTYFTQAFDVTIQKNEAITTRTVHASFLYNHQDDGKEVKESPLQLAKSQLEVIQGDKNNAFGPLKSINLDAWKVAPNHQAQKVKEQIEAYLNNDSIGIEVSVVPPLTTVIGTKITQQFTVVLIEEDKKEKVTVHASFVY